MANTIKVTHLTPEGYEKLLAERTKLRQKDLPETLERLKEAIAQGDISENAEYDTAMSEKDMIEARLAEIDLMLDNVEIIETKEIGDEISYGSTITFIDDKDRSFKMTIVGSGEVSVSDQENMKVSLESPLGIAIKGKKKGDKVFVKAPNRKYQIEITSVK